MAFDLLSLIGALLVTLTSLVLIGVRNWRFSIGLLAVQYIGVFILVASIWPFPIAAVKIIAGWMAAAILVMAIVGSPEIDQTNPANEPIDSQPVKRTSLTPSSLIFFNIAAILVGLAVISQVPQLPGAISKISLAQALGGMIMIGFGLLKLGFTDNSLAALLGFLTIFGGFEIIYSGLESSSLTTGLLAGVTLGIALVGAYILLAPSMEDAP